MQQSKSKCELQETQYDFPYHHIAHFKYNGKPTLSRNVGWWGLEYLCYQNHLLTKICRMKPSSVLDVGCGDGSFIGNLPSDIEVRVGADLSERAIAFAKAFYPNCVFYDTDIGTLKESFDIVTAIEVIEHIHDFFIADLFRKMAARVCDSGSIVVCVPTLIKALTAKHYRHYSIQTLQNQLVTSGIPFRIVDIEYIFVKPKWFDFGRKFFSNRFFCLEVSAVTQFVWDQIWNKYRIGNQETGHHLVAVLRKQAF